MYFTDRYDAAMQLAPFLEKYKNEEGVVLAVPRGGVPIGYYLAKHLNFSDYAFSSPLRIFNHSGPIVPANAARSISRYVLAFFDQHLKRIDQSLLAGTSHASDSGFERSTGRTPSPIR